VLAPAVAEQVGGDAEEVAASLVGGHCGGLAEEEAAEGLLEEIVGEVLTAGDAEEIGEERAGDGGVEDLELGLVEGGGGVAVPAEGSGGNIGGLGGHGASFPGDRGRGRKGKCRA
jgi:hypothetical protein